MPILYKDRDWLVEQYINNKKSAYQIRKEYGISIDLIYYWLKKYQIPRRKVGKIMLSMKQKIESHISIIPDGCWNWTGKISKITGYGHVGFNYKTYLAHRLSYIVYKGSIPEGMVIDHLCRNRKCVNPLHLEAVSLKENILRGNSLPAYKARQIHCIRRHILLGANLYITPDGRRQCKTCRAFMNRNNRLRKKELSIASHTDLRQF